MIFSLNCQKEIIKIVLGGFGVGNLKYKCLKLPYRLRFFVALAISVLCDAAPSLCR